MQITVSGKQVDLSDALRTRVSTQLETIAGKYFDHALEAQVTFSRARSFFTCDINLHAGRGLQLRGEGDAPDANAAFDAAAEHIAKRLRRYRRRVNEHARDLAQRERPESARQVILRQEIDGEGEAASESHLDGVAQDGVAEDSRTLDELFATVVAETQTHIAVLTVGEAVMRMDLGNQPAMMFRNRSNGALNVVYRRTDGHIGWIDPGPQAATPS